MKAESTESQAAPQRGLLGKGPSGGPATEPSLARGDRYDTPPNPQLLELVPAGAKLVLDVGCATGNFGAALKGQRPGLVVHGLEQDRATAAQAAARLDRVFVADLGAGLPTLAGPYDCIVCGDVLEHLVDPWSALRSLVGVLAPGGSVVASLPNVRHYRVLRDLVLRGRFTYRETGVLDSTHLRFFTLREMEALFERAGLRVVERRPRLHGGNALIKLIGLFRPRAAEELRAVQFTLVGRRV
ncbi:MAG: class I SAM-dependent methyltransferase [Planctomycetota bacterium]